MALLDSIWPYLGGFQANLGLFWVNFGLFFTQFCPILHYFGLNSSILDLFLGSSSPNLAILGVLEGVSRQFWVILGVFEPIWGDLGTFWPHFAPVLPKFCEWGPLPVKFWNFERFQNFGPQKVTPGRGGLGCTPGRGVSGVTFLKMTFSSKMT